MRAAIALAVTVREQARVLARIALGIDAAG